MMASLLLLAAAFSTAVFGLQQATNDMCFAADLRLALANNSLYFMGGVYTINGFSTDSYQNYIYSIPLDKPFSTKGLLSSVDYIYQSASGEVYTNQGAFFTDPNITTLYSFAGFKDPSSPIDTVLAYNVETEQFSNPSVSGGSFNFDSRSAALEATSEYTDLGLSFFSGGWVDIPGMIRFDASDPQNPTWTNETNNNVPLTLDGSMEFVRYGKEGSLIEFGGYNKDYKDPALTGWTYDSRDMSIIGVYDVFSSTWYNVTAEGSIPSNRSAFCTAVSASPDDSSMQITMYGGWDLWSGVDMADIYVLTIPSFQWIQVTDQSNIEFTLFPGNTTGRDSHKCKTYKDRTMLSVGGYVRAGSAMMNKEVCNSSWPVVRVLDTSTYTFLDSFDPDADAYYVPDAVTEIIGGNGQGGATMTAPVAGFTDSALDAIFAQTVKRYNQPGTGTISTAASSGTGTGTAATATGSSSSSTGSSSPLSGGQVASSSSHTGAIAGGVVAGVLVIALAAGLAWFFTRRRRQQRHFSGITMEQKPAAPRPHMPEMASSDEVVYPNGGAYYKPDMHNSPTPPVEADGGYRGVEADSYSRQAPGRIETSELPG